MLVTACVAMYTMLSLWCVAPGYDRASVASSTGLVRASVAISTTTTRGAHPGCSM